MSAFANYGYAGAAGLVLVFGLFVGPVVVAIAQSPFDGLEGRTGRTQAEAVSALGSREWTERREAVSEIMRVPAGRRSLESELAIARELARLQRMPSLGLEEVPGDDRSAGWDYYTDLVSVAAASTNPVMLPVLIHAMDTGNAAMDAVATFGEVAVIPVLVRMSEKPADPVRQSDGFRVFVKMLRNGTVLSPPSRTAVGQMAARCLTGRQRAVVVRQALTVASLLGEASLLPSVRRIAAANTPSQAGLTLLGDVDFLEFKRLASDALLAKAEP